MVLSGHESTYNCGGDGETQMGKDDAQAKDAEHTESDRGGISQADGLTESQAVRDCQEGGGGEVGQIYFLETENGQFVKIGYSKNVIVRLSQLGTLRPGSFAIKALGSVPGTLAIERWLHERFSDDRDNGEWFRKSTRLSAFIESLGLVPPAIVERKQRPHKLPQRARRLYIQPELEPEQAFENVSAETQAADLAEMFSRLGMKGGKARAESLTTKQRQEIARDAANKRWEEWRKKNKKKSTAGS